jgi:hypothetical protein
MLGACLGAVGGISPEIAAPWKNRSPVRAAKALATGWFYEGGDIWNLTQYRCCGGHRLAPETRAFLIVTGLNQNDHLCYTAIMSTDAEIRNQIANRNSIRGEAKLPPLDGDRELAKLRAAREQKTFEAVFQVERIRFDRWISEGEGFLSKMGRWSKARQQVLNELRMGNLKSE